MPTGQARHTPRTLLGQRIRDMRLSIEEFAEYAERYARDHGERGTISVRHLQRLVAGQRGDGRPLGALNPATARLLEHIFGESITRLLAPPTAPTEPDDPAEELRQALLVAHRVDGKIINLLREQLDKIRRIDRQLGARVARGELLVKLRQVSDLMTHSTTPDKRRSLATVLSELETLAGWQALDQRQFTKSWRHYERARLVAAECGAHAHAVHAKAEQAFVLLDANQADNAVEILEAAHSEAEGFASPTLRSWLSAAYGESLAINGRRSDSLRAFDAAARLLSDGDTTSDQPYLALNSAHLKRWRGHALARFGDNDAIEVLSSSLTCLDPSFSRARSGLLVDLATASAARGNHETARNHLKQAMKLAREVGSARQRRRLDSLMRSSPTPLT